MWKEPGKGSLTGHTAQELPESQLDPKWKQRDSQLTLTSPRKHGGVKDRGTRSLVSHGSNFGCPMYLTRLFPVPDP